jgi:hypothetical protein
MATKSDIVMYLIEEAELYNQLQDKIESKLIDFNKNENLLHNLKEKAKLYSEYDMTIRKSIQIFENLNPDLILTNNDVKLNRDEVVMYLINEDKKYKGYNKSLKETIQIIMICNAEVLNKNFDEDMEMFKNL